MHYASDKFNINVGPDIGSQILAANVGPQKCGPQMLARKYWPANFGPQILTRKFWPANVGPQMLARKYWPANFGPQPAARSPHSSHSRVCLLQKVWRVMQGELPNYSSCTTDLKKKKKKKTLGRVNSITLKQTAFCNDVHVASPFHLYF